MAFIILRVSQGIESGKIYKTPAFDIILCDRPTAVATKDRPGPDT
jgi:hypothetical protein